MVKVARGRAVAGSSSKFQVQCDTYRCHFRQESLFHFVLAGEGAVFSLMLRKKQVPGPDLEGLAEATLVSVGGRMGRRVEGQDTSLVWFDSPRFHVYVVGSRERSGRLLQLVERLMTPLEALWA